VRLGALALLLGGAVGLAALTRAEAAFLAVLLIVPLALLTTNHTWRVRAIRGGMALVASAAVVAPWVIRNAVTFESHPLTLSNGSGFVIEISNCDQTYGLAAPTDASGNALANEDVDKNLGYWAPECDRTPWPPGDETVVAAAKQQTGTDYIASHQRRFPVVVAARVGRIWDLWRPRQSYDFNRFFENRKDITIGSPDGPNVTFSPVLVAMVMYYPLLAASVVGLWLLWRRRLTIVPFVAIVIMTTLTAAISFGITRYRVGADACLPILAAVAIDALWRRRRSPADATDAAGSGDVDASGHAPDERASKRTGSHDRNGADDTLATAGGSR
jgi:4-amino-4-deoxy-L-arabinose transferase-like glycosyltransferase